MIRKPLSTACALAAALLLTWGAVPTLAAPVAPAGVQFVAEAEGIAEYRLANGMKVLLVENRVAPVATFLVVYRVGSRDEAVGYTGATHLLEHLLFKGTPTFNREKGTQIAATLQRIGARFNATTWLDRTTYFETVPSDQLELAIRLEADRMRNAFIADADRRSEMTVVRNELERGENSPAQVLEQALYATAFKAHPYHHPTIGWRSDVENVPTARLKQFYDDFYWPANATAIVVGDFERTNVLGLIARYFGAIGRPPEPIPPMYTEEPPQEGERRVVVRRAGELPIVKIGFHAPAALGQTSVLSGPQLAERAATSPARNDLYALDVLSLALSEGITSRLYQALVEKQLAVDVDAGSDTHRDPGLFTLSATVRPGVDPAKVEQVLLAEVEKVVRAGLTPAEVEKARTQLLAQLAYGRDGTFNIAAQLAEAEAVADWNYYRTYDDNIGKVTPADVQRAAATYFTAKNRTVATFLPEGRGGSAPPAAAPRGLQHWRTPDAQQPTLLAQTPAPPPAPPSTAPAQTPPASRPASQPVSFVGRTERTRLPNGATLLVIENRATPSVALRGSLLAGSAFEPPTKPGLASLTAAMLERGTRRRTKLQLAQTLESVGADLSFSGDTFALNFTGRALSKDVPRLLEVLAEELKEPAFPADELQKLKQQAIASLRERQNNTGYRSYQRFTTLVYDPANPYYVADVDKLAASIASITPEDLRRFWQQHYSGRSLILSVAGDVDSDAVRRLFADAFARFDGPEVQVPAAPAAAPIPKRDAVAIPDKANVDIVLGLPASLKRSSPDFHAATLANNALGQSTLSSRLGLVVRDREGLTYGISSRFGSPTLEPGPWFVTVSVNPQNVQKAIDTTVAVVRDYVEKGIRPEELADEKSAAIGSFKVALSTNSGLAQALWNTEFYKLGIDYLDRYPEIVNAVTREQVNGAIRKYFRPDQFTVVTAGNVTPATQPAGNK